MSRIPPVDCQGSASWDQFSKLVNVSNEGTVAEAEENVTAPDEEAIVEAEDSTAGAKGSERVDATDRGCTIISPEEGGAELD
jgi:hypothetical protein